MGRILVADSDPHVLMLCREELREEGYEVVVAANGHEALGLLDTVRPDLVVLEIMLPDMSGMETLKIIKGTCSTTPVIFHSTYGLPEAGAVSQCDGVVLKTHDLESLKKAVRRFVPGLKPAKNSLNRRAGGLVPRFRAGIRHGFNGN
jgi:two-component system, OmpR family, response regulator